MTKAIIVLAKDLPVWWEQCSLPRMRQYANICEAELVVHTPEKWQGMMTRMETADLVARYDRSLVLDADAVISREAPSIFNAFSDGFAWATSDSAPNDPKAERQFPIIVALQAICGSLGWSEGYANTGVVLCDREHARLWKEWVPLPKDMCPDQANLNYRIRKTARCFTPLPRQWNSFGLNSVGWDGGWPNALEHIPAICRGAYIAHAAGFAEPERSIAIRRMDVILP